MRYPAMMEMLNKHPSYGILVYVGRLPFEIPRETFLKRIEEKRGYNLQVQVQVDHDCNEIVVSEGEVNNVEPIVRPNSSLLRWMLASEGEVNNVG